MQVGRCSVSRAMVKGYHLVPMAGSGSGPSKVYNFHYSLIIKDIEPVFSEHSQNVIVVCLCKA